MSDRRRRELERRLATGDKSAEEPWIVERANAGEIPWYRVDIYRENKVIISAELERRAEEQRAREEAKKERAKINFYRGSIIGLFTQLRDRIPRERQKIAVLSDAVLQILLWVSLAFAIVAISDKSDVDSAEQQSSATQSQNDSR